MKQKFGELEKILRQTAQARQDLKSTIVKLNKQRKDYSEERAKEFIDPQIKKAQNGMSALHLAGYEKALGLLDQLNGLAVAKHSKLKLDNPAWQNALKLIELSGAGLDSETVNNINSNFTGDQPALRALRDVYKANGVVYDGELDKQIYDPESAFEHLGEWAYNSFIKEGSLNRFASAINKVASMEGIEFPKMVDEAGSDDVMRAAAGLPDVVAEGE